MVNSNSNSSDLHQRTTALTESHPKKTQLKEKKLNFRIGAEIALAWITRVSQGVTVTLLPTTKSVMVINTSVYVNSGFSHNWDQVQSALHWYPHSKVWEDIFYTGTTAIICTCMHTHTHGIKRNNFVWLTTWPGTLRPQIEEYRSLCLPPSFRTPLAEANDRNGGRRSGWRI